MKTHLTILAALLSLISFPAGAFADHQYAPMGGNQKQPFDVYTDGKNTYIEAVKGLLVRGATREGDSFVVLGVPDRFIVQFNGKPMVIGRTAPQAAQVANQVNYTDQNAPVDRSQEVIKEVDIGARSVLTEEERSKLQAEVRAQVSADVIAQLQIQLQEAKSAAAEIKIPALYENSAVDLNATPVVVSGKVAIPAAEPKVSEQGKPVALAQPLDSSNVPLNVPGNNQTDTPTLDSKAAETVLAVAATPTAPPILPVITTIKRGSLIHESLKLRAEADGWTFLWYPTFSWEAIGDIDLTRYKNADEAVDDIVTGLREEGKPIQLRISDGNKIMEILSTEVKND